MPTLADYIRAHGPIKTVRVSSAQASGAAKQYAYWGAVRYELCLTRDGRVSHKALERATSARRSLRLAEQDAEAIAEREGRIRVQPIGRVDKSTVEEVLALLRHPADCLDCLRVRQEREAEEAARRARQAQRTARLCARSNWLDRAAIGHYSTAGVDPETKILVAHRRHKIERLRAERRESCEMPLVKRSGIRETSYHGIPLFVRWDIHSLRKVEWRPRRIEDPRLPYAPYTYQRWFPSPRKAAQSLFRSRVWYLNTGVLHRDEGGKYYLPPTNFSATFRAWAFRTWDRRPSREELAVAVLELSSLEAGNYERSKQ